MKRQLQPPNKQSRPPIPQSTRFNVLRRDNFTCRYCGQKSPDVILHCDHAVSVKEGGDDSEGNLITACVDCNLGKSSKSVNPTTETPAVTGIIGLWGHTFDENKMLTWQFKIIRQIDDETYLCQLFSWMDGDATECKAIKTSVLFGTCKLYATNEAMKQAHDKFWEHQGYIREREREAERETQRSVDRAKLQMIKDPSPV